LEGELELSVLEVFGGNWVVEAFFLCEIIRKIIIMHPLPQSPIFKASSLASILKLPDYYNHETGVYYRNPSSVDSFSKLHHSREESAEKVKCSQGLHWRRRRGMMTMMKKVVICQAALTHTGVVDNDGKTTPNSAHPFVQVCNVLSVSATFLASSFLFLFTMRMDTFKAFCGISSKHSQYVFFCNLIWFSPCNLIQFLSAISFNFLSAIASEYKTF